MEHKRVFGVGMGDPFFAGSFCGIGLTVKAEATGAIFGGSSFPHSHTLLSPIEAAGVPHEVFSRRGMTP